MYTASKMASKILQQARRRFLFTTVHRKALGALHKRNMSEFKQQMVELEKHAEKTYLTWRNISLFVAFPVSSYLFYKHVIAGEHIEAPKEFIGYDHIRIRRKAFPWGDGDKSLFHNQKYNVGPDTDFDAEEKHEEKNEEPFITRLIRHFTPSHEDQIKKRDEYLIRATIISVENLEYLQQPKFPPAPRHLFINQDHLKRPRSLGVDD